jgi:multidrug resistance efflux pump
MVANLMITEQDYNDRAELIQAEVELPASIQRLQGKVDEAQDFFDRFGCLSNDLFNDAQATLDAAKAELSAALAEWQADPAEYLKQTDDAGIERDYAALRCEM